MVQYHLETYLNKILYRKIYEKIDKGMPWNQDYTKALNAEKEILSQNKKWQAYIYLIATMVEEIGYNNIGCAGYLFNNSFIGYLLDINKFNPLSCGLNPLTAYCNISHSKYPDIFLYVSLNGRKKAVAFLKQAFGEDNIFNVLSSIGKKINFAKIYASKNAPKDKWKEIKFKHDEKAPKVFDCTQNEVYDEAIEFTILVSSNISGNEYLESHPGKRFFLFDENIPRNGIVGVFSNNDELKKYQGWLAKRNDGLWLSCTAVDMAEYAAEQSGSFFVEEEVEKISENNHVTYQEAYQILKNDGTKRISKAEMIGFYLDIINHLDDKARSTVA